MKCHACHAKRHFANERFCSFPHRQGDAASILMNLKICRLKIDVSFEASVNFHRRWQKPTPGTEYARCHRLTQPCVSQNNTQHDTSEAPHLPRKMTVEVTKALRRPQKRQLIFWKRCKSIVPHTKNDFPQVMKHVGMSQKATPATRNEANATFEMSKTDYFCRARQEARPYDPHAVLDGCERLQTCANDCATSGEHILNPQAPRVKRERNPCYAFGKNPWVTLLVLDEVMKVIFGGNLAFHGFKMNGNK